MIEKIKGDYYGHEIDGEIVEGYQLTGEQAKINEIIDVVNALKHDFDLLWNYTKKTDDD